MGARMNPTNLPWLGLAVACNLAMGCGAGSSRTLGAPGNPADASSVGKDAAAAHEMLGSGAPEGGTLRLDAAGDVFKNSIGDSGERALEPDGAPGAAACIGDNKPCEADADTCCQGVCTNSACGGCRDEGTPCRQSSDCCDNLACTKAGDAGLSYCGTNLCSPKGTACGGASDVTCCDESCNNGTCGG
jgi:hypothetical protein